MIAALFLVLFLYQEESFPFSEISGDYTNISIILITSESTDATDSKNERFHFESTSPEAAEIMSLLEAQSYSTTPVQRIKSRLSQNHTVSSSETILDIVFWKDGELLKSMWLAGSDGILMDGCLYYIGERWTDSDEIALANAIQNSLD